MKGKIKVAVVLATLLTASTVHSQGSRRERLKGKPATPRTDQKASPITSIVLDVARLPAGYTGTDPEVVYAELERRAKQGAKGEFETTEAFRKRAQELEQRPLADGVPLDSQLAFMATATSAYDADGGKLKCVIALDWPHLDYSIDFHKSAILLKKIIDPTDSYIGQNAFGAKVRVDRYYAREYGVLLAGHGSSSITPRSLEVDVDMNPAAAVKAKPTLRALLIITLESPYIRNGDRLSEPTISDPTDRWVRYRYLVGHLSQVWIYNFITGDVYSKTLLNTQELPTKESGINSGRGSLNTARDLYERGRDDEALPEIRKVLIAEPTNAEAFLLSGRIYQRQGDQEAAIAALKTAIFWNSKLIDAHVLLGSIYLERGNAGEARKYASSAIDIDPTNQDALALEKRIKASPP